MEADKPIIKHRKFPWSCFRCRQLDVFPAVIRYSLEVNYEGAVYKLDIPELTTPRCRNCGQVVFSTNVDEQINNAQRRLLHLLHPPEILAGRERLGLTRAQLAERLGVAEAALADWEDNISIQPRTADNLMRVFFAFPEVRAALAGRQPDPTLGVLVG